MTRARQPRGLYVLFLTEMWERFGFYAMASLFVLYLTEARGRDDAQAYLLFGAYSSYVYLTTVAGGLIADRLLGFGRAILLGSVLLGCGYAALGLPGETAMAVALGLLVVGNGYFKPNVSSLVGRLYAADDPRRESGFTLFYMGINLGAMAATLVAGWVAQRWGFGPAFALAGGGLAVALVTFLAGRGAFHGADRPPPQAQGGRALLALGAGTLAAVGLAAVLMQHAVAAGELLAACGAVAIGFFLREVWREDPPVRRRLVALLVLILFAIGFFALYQQQSLSVLLFVKRDVDLEILGVTLAPGQVQALNPVFILLLAPALALALAWTRLGPRAPGNPAKIVLGLIALALGFAVLAAGDHLAMPAKSGLLTVGGFFLLLTVGELLVSPVCLALVTRLAPVRLAGFAMGMWFLGTALANYLGGVAAEAAALRPGLPPADEAAAYARAFLAYGAATLACGVILLALVPRLDRWIRAGDAAHAADSA